MSRLCILTLATALLAPLALAAPPVSHLRAAPRDGQVFLTWDEAATPDGTTFNVYRADHPITDVSKATRVAHHVERHSARDWWEDPASFDKKNKPAEKQVGFRIADDGQRLDPTGGLFVYTAHPGEAATLFFAVTTSDAAGKEDATIMAGANALAQGVAAPTGAIRPIWQAAGKPHAAGAAKGLPLWLNIHAKGGVIANSEYLVFADETMGWRAGLPFKFSVRIENGELVLRPTDRVWINRPHDEASDGGTPAIWTFWWGYNSNIYDRKLMASGVPTNYTERRLLWMLNWVSEHYQTDRNRWYCSGSSMGGCGTISFGLRHPELFAALHANIPITNYTYLGPSGALLSAGRLEPACWIGRIPPDLKNSDGVSLLEALSGTKFVTENKADLPPLFMINGRKDGSIPWENNPPFWRAIGAARQSVTAYWDEGTHSTSGKDAPADVKAWLTIFRRFKLNESFPAFTNTSSSRNFGDGRPADGDPIGWLNRGMDWKEIEDAPDHYAITLTADYPGVVYPVRTDVTPRRLQQFKPGIGQPLTARIGSAAPIKLMADGTGLFTIPNVTIESKAGTRVVIQRQ